MSGPLTGYNDRLPPRKEVDREIAAMARARRGIKDPYSEEVGPGAGIMRGLEGWIGDNVVDPAAKAGYPELGSGIGAGAASIADFLIPQTGADFSGVLLPFGKASKGLKATSAAPTKTSKSYSFSDWARHRDEVRDRITRENIAIPRFVRQDLLGGGQMTDMSIAARLRADPHRLQQIQDANPTLSREQILNSFEDTGPSNLLEDMPASRPETIKPLTKEEQAAKRAAENQRVMRDAQQENRSYQAAEEPSAADTAKRKWGEKQRDPVHLNIAENNRVIKKARELLDPASAPIDPLTGKPVRGPHLPFSNGYRPMKGKEAEFEALRRRYQELGDEFDRIKGQGFETVAHVGDYTLKKSPNGLYFIEGFDGRYKTRDEAESEMMRLMGGGD